LLTRNQPVLVELLALLMLVLLPVGLLLVEPPLVVDPRVLGEPLVGLRQEERVPLRPMAACRAACQHRGASLVSQAVLLHPGKRVPPVLQVPMHLCDPPGRKIHRRYQALHRALSNASFC
jgi:hypothetical protein